MQEIVNPLPFEKGEFTMIIEDGILSMAAHAIGMDDAPTFQKFGKTHFVSTRNFYVDAKRNADWDDWVCHGLATAMDYPGGHVNYSLTEKGYEKLGKELNIVIHSKFLAEPQPELTSDQIEEIKDVWAWIKEHDIYASKHLELDVAIYLSNSELEDFMARFCSEEYTTPARLYASAVIVMFTDVLGFEVTREQIWNLRPDGIRETW